MNDDLNASIETFYARERPRMNAKVGAAADVFMEMTRHVASCEHCSIIEVAFFDAKDRADELEAQRLAGRYCDTMNEMAERFAPLMGEAFG